MPEPSVREEALGRLLVLQSALHAAPDERRLCEMVAEAFAGLPGVTGSAVCLEGTLHGSTLPPGVPRCAAAPGGPRACGLDCEGSTGDGLALVRLATPRATFGALVLAGSGEALAQHRPAARNVANLAALRLETERQQAALAALNQALEARVAERTALLGAEKARLDAALEALGRSEARFRALTERSTDILVVLDAHRRITYWSPSATEQLGWTAEEACGAHGGDLIHPDDRPRSRELFEEVTRTPGASVRFLRRHLHRDGSVRLMEVDARNLLDDPAVRGVVAHLRDLTDLRRLEEQFHQAQKLESLGRLAGGVAHDFNNLLTVILSCAGALRRDLAGGQPAQAEDVEEIRGAAERARELTRQLLAFARRQVVAPVPLDLNEVVRRAEKLLRRVLGEDVALEVELATAPAPVLADPGQLEQVLLNLAVNARDAMPRGGTLSIATGRADEAGGPGEPAREWVSLTVRDTGVGLSQEAQAHLFEPFFTTKGPGKGTGLGLATVYGIVAQAGGRLRVRSALGQGAEFEVRLPRGRQDPAPVEPPAPAPPRGGCETVLVVEDDASVRAVTARALRAGGYRVLEAAGGEAALELAGRAAEPIHLVVTDVVMPGLDGRAVVEALRVRRPGLPALFVSGYSHDIISHHGALDSGLDFLSKPFTDELLLERVRAVLDRPAPRP